MILFIAYIYQLTHEPYMEIITDDLKQKLELACYQFSQFLQIV